MKIYFACSMRGGRVDTEVCRKIVEILEKYGVERFVKMAAK
jgi:hypothetical protein